MSLTNFKLSALSLHIKSGLTMVLKRGPFGSNNDHLATNLINFVLANYVFGLQQQTTLLTPTPSHPFKYKRDQKRAGWSQWTESKPESADRNRVQQKGLDSCSFYSNSLPHSLCLPSSFSTSFLLRLALLTGIARIQRNSVGKNEYARKEFAPLNEYSYESDNEFEFVMHTNLFVKASNVLPRNQMPLALSLALVTKAI